MPYDKYTDSNGITWSIINTQNGYTLLASVLDDADPKYDPPAEDLSATMLHRPSFGGVPLTSAPSDPPTGEQQRVLFTELSGKIEEYAKGHRTNTILKVVGKPGVPWWVWVGLGLLALGSKRPRR